MLKNTKVVFQLSHIKDGFTIGQMLIHLELIENSSEDTLSSPVLPLVP